MKKALVQPDGRVAQVEPVNANPASGGIPFPVHPSLQWLDCSDSVVTDWKWDGKAFVAPLTPPPGPDVSGFVSDLKAAMGGIVASNALAKSYPLFQPALAASNFADVQVLIIDAHATLVLSDAQYAAFKQLAAKHGLPITLP